MPMFIGVIGVIGVWDDVPVVQLLSTKIVHFYDKSVKNLSHFLKWKEHLFLSFAIRRSIS